MAESVAPTESAAASVYQLRAVVAEVSPLIWRRLLVPTTTTIEGLHAVLQTIEDLECQLDEGGKEATFEQVRLVKAVGEFDTYIRANADRIPNYGERHRASRVWQRPVKPSVARRQARRPASFASRPTRPRRAPR